MPMKRPMKICVVTLGMRPRRAGAASAVATFTGWAPWWHSRSRAVQSGGPVQRLGHHGDHVALLLGGQLAVDGQRERLTGRPLGMRELAPAIPEMGEAGLLVERHRVV